MSVDLEDWAPAFADELRRMDRSVRRDLRFERRELLRQVVRAAPRRTGALRRSFVEAEGRRRDGSGEIRSTHPGAVRVSEGGVIRPIRSRYLVIPLHRGYRHGAGGYVTLPGRGGTRVVVRRDTASRVEAILTRTVRVRGTGYLERAARLYEQRAPSRIEERLARRLEAVDG